MSALARIFPFGLLLACCSCTPAPLSDRDQFAKEVISPIPKSVGDIVIDKIAEDRWGLIIAFKLAPSDYDVIMKAHSFSEVADSTGTTLIIPKRVLSVFGARHPGYWRPNNPRYYIYLGDDAFFIIADESKSHLFFIRISYG